MPKHRMKETSCEQKVMDYLSSLEPLRIDKDGKKVVMASVREVAEATKIHRVTASRTFKRLQEPAEASGGRQRLVVVGMDTSRQRRKHWKIVA